MAAGVGHHLVTELSKLLRGSPAVKWLNKMVTGPLADATKNYYSAAHRLYNQAVKEIVQNMEKELGKNLGQFSRQEVADLGRRILHSPNARIQNFIKSLGKTKAGQTARQALGAAQAIVEGLAGGATEFVLPFAVLPEKRYD